MAKPLSEDSLHYIVVGYDAETINIYHLRSNSPDRARVRIKFEMHAESQGWKPFQKIEVIRLGSDEELESVVSLGTGNFIERDAQT